MGMRPLSDFRGRIVLDLLRSVAWKMGSRGQAGCGNQTGVFRAWMSATCLRSIWRAFLTCWTKALNSLSCHLRGQTFWHQPSYIMACMVSFHFVLPRKVFAMPLIMQEKKRMARADSPGCQMARWMLLGFPDLVQLLIAALASAVQAGRLGSGRPRSGCRADRPSATCAARLCGPLALLKDAQWKYQPEAPCLGVGSRTSIMCRSGVTAKTHAGSFLHGCARIILLAKPCPS